MCGLWLCRVTAVDVITGSLTESRAMQYRAASLAVLWLMLIPTMLEMLGMVQHKNSYHP
jgi:hypothetical protein